MASQGPLPLLRTYYWAAIGKTGPIPDGPSPSGPQSSSNSSTSPALPAILPSDDSGGGALKGPIVAAVVVPVTIVGLAAVSALVAIVMYFQRHARSHKTWLGKVRKCVWGSALWGVRFKPTTLAPTLLVHGQG
jgi:hypothetical protein